MDRKDDGRTISPEHLALVRRIASQVARNIPPHLAVGLFEDLVGDGCVGYLEALARFDPGKGVEFGVYARTRIRGAMVDGLRRLDIMSRDDRRAQRNLLGVQGTLTAALGRLPTEVELAARSGITVDQVRQLLTGATIEVMDPFCRDFVNIPVPEAESGALRFEEAMRVATLLDRAIRALEPREEHVVRRHIFDEITFAEIGVELAISESRVCQLHNGALVKLRVLYEQMARAEQLLRQQLPVTDSGEGSEAFATELAATGAALDGLLEQNDPYEDPDGGGS